MVFTRVLVILDGFQHKLLMLKHFEHVWYYFDILNIITNTLAIFYLLDSPIYIYVLGNVECLDEAMQTFGTSMTHAYEHHYLVWYFLSVNGKLTQAGHVVLGFCWCIQTRMQSTIVWDHVQILFQPTTSACVFG
jgi:hypothetical protein